MGPRDMTVLISPLLKAEDSSHDLLTICCVLIPHVVMNLKQSAFQSVLGHQGTHSQLAEGYHHDRVKPSGAANISLSRTSYPAYTVALVLHRT